MIVLSEELTHASDAAADAGKAAAAEVARARERGERAAAAEAAAWQRRCDDSEAHLIALADELAAARAETAAATATAAAAAAPAPQPAPPAQPPLEDAERRELAELRETAAQLGRKCAELEDHLVALGAELTHAQVPA